MPETKRTGSRIGSDPSNVNFGAQYPSRGSFAVENKSHIKSRTDTQVTEGDAKPDCKVIVPITKTTETYGTGNNEGGQRIVAAPKLNIDKKLATITENTTIELSGVPSSNMTIVQTDNLQVENQHSHKTANSNDETKIEAQV